MESGQTPPEQPPPSAQQPIFVAPGQAPPPGYLPYYPGQQIPSRKPNGNATASLITSGGALALLIFTAGILAPMTAVASVVGTVLGHKAKVRTDEDPEVGQRDEAIAGFWMGIAGIVLAVIAIIVWVIVIVWLASVNEGVDSSTFHHPYIGPDYQY
jgi:hypothetical protein